GNGNYLELPPSLFTGLNEATLECRVKWHTFDGNQHVFEFDAAKRVKVGNLAGTADLSFQAAVPESPKAAQAKPQGARSAEFANESLLEFEKREAAASNVETSDSIEQKGALTLNHWHHLAVVFDRSATRVYLDGAFVGTAPYTGGIGSVSGAGRHLIGS